MRFSLPSATSRAALACLLFTSLLGAQEAPLGFSKALKLRAGYGFSTEDHLRASSLGVGFQVGYGMSYGTFGVEVGYYYKTGDPYLEPIQGTPPAPLSAIDPTRSGDSRRNQLDGLSVRLSFEQPFSESWTWQAGLMIGGTRFQHEYVGDVEGVNWNGANPNSWRDTYSGIHQTGGLSPSVFGGVTYRLTRFSSLEFNLLLLNYSAANYVHHPGTAAGGYPIPTNPSPYTDPGGLGAHNAFPNDSIATKRRLIPHLEFGYVLRF
ncbi:MAG: hypothetical protein LWX11_05030 [Firmicutes bacterium]|nr:hypothetical protein [Bacillota bacterium]